MVDDQGAERVTVTHDSNGFVRMPLRQRLETADHAYLRLQHQFTSGRAYAAAIGVEASKVLEPVEFIEGLSFPLPQPHLAQFFEGLCSEAVP